MNEITFITFNCGNAGRYVNGPGMCLVNFVKKLKSLGLKINIFSKLKSKEPGVKSLDDHLALYKAIKRSKILHHWSGIGPAFSRAISKANSYDKKVIVGPNVIDTVAFDKETRFLSRLKFDHLLTVNERLKYRISKEHDIFLDKIDVLMVGPDEELWRPISKDNNRILWKGNSKQFVKDVNFGLELAKALPEYRFEFIGYPKPYDYNGHVNLAKSCHLFISTSLSETMGLALAEQWCAGIPSVTHPKIYLHGENYKTGIVTSRDIPSYCDAIREIMEDDTLYENLSFGAREYILNNFSDIGTEYVNRYLEGRVN
jgi:glycosyltransferase involved in cell wall biosynthesis